MAMAFVNRRVFFADPGAPMPANCVSLTAAVACSESASAITVEDAHSRSVAIAQSRSDDDTVASDNIDTVASDTPSLPRQSHSKRQISNGYHRWSQKVK